ncbi:MAG: type II secretion system protein GspG [Planctomycetes bacterium]|nr:type II secretion system protein GspG [Planctomycetota bacterium]
MRYIWFACICVSVLLVTFFINFIVNIDRFAWPNHPISEPVTGHLAYYYTKYPRYEKDILDNVQGHLQIISKHLKLYRTKNNRYPTNDEGLAVLSELKAQLIEEYAYLPAPMGKQPKDKGSVYYGLQGGMCPFESGILSSWFEPFVYENRNGLPENLFSDSPVNKYKGGLYSIRVADGIYVYSVGAISYYQDYIDALAKRTRTRIIVWCLPFISFILLNIFLYLFIKANKLSNRNPAKLWIKLIKIAGGIIIILGTVLIGLKKPMQNTVSCYSMAPYFDLSRRPEIISQYNDLLDKYHQQGIIKDATYQKTRKAMDEVNKYFKGND